MAEGSSKEPYSLEQHLQMTVDFIRVKESLDIIVFLGRMNTRGPNVGKLVTCEPSWIPDWLEQQTWSNRRIKAYLRSKIFFRSVIHGCITGRRTWNASLGTKPAFLIRGTCLRAKGLLLDTISSLTTTYFEIDGRQRADTSNAAPRPEYSTYSGYVQNDRGSERQKASASASSNTRRTSHPESPGNSSLTESNEANIKTSNTRRTTTITDNPNGPKPPTSTTLLSEDEAYKSKGAVYLAVFHLLNFHIHLPLSPESKQDSNPEDSYIPFACEHIAFLSIFANIENWKVVKSTTPELARWLKQNRNFPIKNNKDGSNALVLSEYLKHPHISLYEHLLKKKLEDVDVRVALLRTMSILAFGRRLALTKNAGYLGWVPETALEGDFIALLAGCSVPVVLRPRPTGGFVIVGDSHFHDLMDGEGMRECQNVEEWPFIDIH